MRCKQKELIMEARSYYQNTHECNDPIFDFANALGSRLGYWIGLLLWFMKDYVRVFVLGTLRCLMSEKWLEAHRESDSDKDRWMKYALSTMGVMLTAGGMVRFYLLLLCD